MVCWSGNTLDTAVVELIEFHLESMYGVRQDELLYVIKDCEKYVLTRYDLSDYHNSHHIIQDALNTMFRFGYDNVNWYLIEEYFQEYYDAQYGCDTDEETTDGGDSEGSE